MADLPLPGPRARIQPRDTTGGTASPLADSFRSGFWGQLAGAARNEASAWQQATPNFNGLDHVPQGYEAYASAFDGATSQSEIDTIRSTIDDNVALRARREHRSFGKNLWTDLLAGVADPVNLVGLGGAVGAGVVRGAVQGAKTLGVAGAIEEGARGALDPTATRAETTVSAAAAMGLGTVIGAAAGKFGRATAPRYGARIDPSIVDGLVRRGIPAHVARGAAAGAAAEGGKVGARGPITRATKGERAEGIGQWLGSRKQSLIRKYGPDALGDKEKQLDHLADELKGEDFGGKYVMAAKTDAEAAAAYITKFMRPAKGKETTGDLERASAALGKPVVEAPNPAATIDRLEGTVLPDQIDGIPVVEMHGEDTPLAMYVPGKSDEQILGEVALEEARLHSQRDALVGGEAEHSPLDGIADARLKDLPGIAKALARRANTEAGFAERLGLEGAGQRAIQEREVLDLLTAERKRVQIERVQKAVDEGDFNFGRKSELVDDAPLERERLTQKVRLLRERIARMNVNGHHVPRRLYDALEEETAELRQLMGGDPNADVMAGELVPDASPLALEGDAFVRDRDAGGPNWRIEGEVGKRNRAVSSDQDPELAALREQDRVKRERDLDSGELADPLPFGLHEGTFGDRDDAHFRINAQKILNLFPAKPWTQAVDGVTPFEPDAFETPAEWLDFVIAHEREHSLNSRLPDESPAAYEDRINQRAYDEVLANREQPLVERRWTLVGTPLHRLYSLIPDATAAIHSNLYKLASDFAVQTQAGKAGRALTPDGSVFQRVQMWRVKSAELRGALNKFYLEEMGMGDSGRIINDVRVMASGLVSKFGSRKSFEQFKQEVVAYHVGFTEEWQGVSYANPSESVKKAAEVMAKIDAQVEKEASSLDIFRQAREDKLRTADKLEKAGMTAEAEALREAANRPMSKMGGNHYYRMYDKSALREQPDLAIERLTAAYKRVGHLEPERAAREAYEHLTIDPDGASGMRRMAHGAKEVQIPWTDAEAFPFIVRDPEASYGVYLRQMGGQIEMTRTFGDPHALDTIDEMRADLEARGVPREKAEEALQIFEDARDHILGQFIRMDALAWDYRVARALKNIGQLAMLGKTIYTQLGDLGRTIGVQGLGVKRMVTGEGPAGLIGGLAAAVRGDLSRFTPGGMAKLAGEANELALARVGALMMDADGMVYAERDTMFERFLAKAQVPFFMLNLMTPWTVALKEVNGLLSAHALIDDAKKVAAAIRSGAEPDAGIVARLGQSNISRADAQLLADMPVEQGTAGLYLPNVMAWQGADGAAMRAKLLAAVNGEIRRAVVTPGPLERHRVFDGVFYSKSGRDKGLEEVAAASDRVDALKQELKRVEPNTAEYADVLERLKEATADYHQARAAVGQAGRNYQPLASLPFQLHSFALASGSKVLNGLFSSSERARIGGVLSLLVGGMYITWIKSQDPIGAITGSSDRKKKKIDAWENMGWDEFIAKSWENSNLGAIFTDVVKNADVAAQSLTGGIVPGWGEQGEMNEKGWSDEIGATAGAVPGLVAGLVEPFVRGDPASAKVAAVRRVVPFANLIWWNGAVDRLTALASDTGQDARASSSGGGYDTPAHAPSGWLVGGTGDDDADPRSTGIAPTLAAMPATEVAHIPDVQLDPNHPLPSKPPKKKKGRKRKPGRFALVDDVA